MSEEDILFNAFWNTAQPLADFKRESGMVLMDANIARAFREQVEAAYRKGWADRGNNNFNSGD